MIDQLLSLSTRQKGLRDAWDWDLGTSLSDVCWKTNIKPCTHFLHGLLKCKMLHRVHLTNARLAKIYPDRTDECNRCKGSPADYVHMFLTCPRLSEYWSAIFKTISEVIGWTINPEPLVVLLGISPTHGLSKSSQHIISFSPLLARRLILLKWTHVSPPTHNKWIHEMLQCITLEKIRFSLKGSLCTSYEVWKPLVNHVDSLTIDAENV